MDQGEKNRGQEIIDPDSFVVDEKVGLFGERMAHRIKQHPERGTSWRVEFDHPVMYDRLVGKVNELRFAMKNGGNPDQIRDECADVAIHAMMLADVFQNSYLLNVDPNWKERDKKRQEDTG
jgi:NTP pyrophosphatase (non-canonical NTP hydrolase)